MATIIGVYFIIISICVSIFQLALALKAPLGSYTLGGKHEGVLPKPLRIAALIQIGILWGFVYIVSSASNLIKNQPTFVSNVLIWFVVVFFFFGTIMNLSSSSKKERNLFGPINLITFVLLIVLVSI
ncbi:MAG: hypothetical protein KGZ51_01205 [Erysipelothrix sp.]|jgi:hypothetical protein|nr:hypothetical protein [Erysipelothrix sp.]